MTFLSGRAPVPIPIPPVSAFLEGTRHALSRLLRRSQRTLDVPLTLSPSNEIRVNYGAVHPRTDPGIVIGGAVKLQALRDRFGESFTDFNCLYLVSSALPPFAEDLVRSAKAMGARLVWNQNGIAYPGWSGWKYPWVNDAMARLLPMADHVVYQSEFCRRSADLFVGPASGTSEVLFNPVDTAVFQPTATPLPLEPWILLAAGTSHNFYRTRASIDCLAALRRRGRPARLIISGELRWSGGEAETHSYIDRFQLREHITFQPPFTRKEAPAVYRQAHLALHPKDKDPCPTVPIEAMASGLPVVGSASGGMPELVPVDCGRLVPVRESWTEDIAPDPSALADAVEAVMADHASFSAAARRHALRAFDQTQWLDRHAAIFEQKLA